MSTTSTTPAGPSATRSARTHAPVERGPFLSRILTTDRDPAAAIARLALGAMILPHGLQKTFGLFGGFGLEGTLEYFTGTMGIPLVLAIGVIAAEFLGGIGLLLGVAGRIAALGVGAVMAGATVLVHWQNGFFMNWNGNMAAGAEGWEFHLLAMALAAVVMIRGSGAASVDLALTRSGLAGRPLNQ